MGRRWKRRMSERKGVTKGRKRKGRKMNIEKERKEGEGGGRGAFQKAKE